jgi:predicted TIM-barrel fold metal-dependent hydrolase
MPYAPPDRVIHDADAHVMETPDWLVPFADPAIRPRVPMLYLATTKPGEDRLIDKLARDHRDPAYRARDAEEIMLRKNWAATGSFLKEDRPAALDLLGFKSQLIFNTFQNTYLSQLEQASDLDFAYGIARAHNRAMVDFCAVDARLLATAYVPLADFARARAMAEEALALGAKALLISSRCPREHSPSHVGLDPLWAVAQEARVPILFHVGGGAPLCSPKYFENGLPRERDFHGGEENFQSIDHMAIPYPPMQQLSTLILDGVFERFPRLMWGVIEQGALWLPGWLRAMDAALEAYGRHENRLKRLTLRPSEYVRRQLRVTPYPTEDVGWIVREAGEETVLFSSDYPHVEGGRNPLRRFAATMQGLPERALDRFYRRNFAELMGPHTPAEA